MAKFKVGDRAVMRGDGCTDASVGEIVTITSVDSEKVSYNTPRGGFCYWYFKNEGDHELELVTTNGEERRMGRRTFKQLQESVTVKKNALWQEACDDGDQEYVLIDDSFNKDISVGRDSRMAIYNRSLVEDNAKHFVEVFKVEPQYMTREELDKWEAFKGRKKPGRKAREAVEIARPKDGRRRPRTDAERKAHSRRMKKYWASKNGRL